jgi:diguanylate cyclase (GGDEF)-like protein
MDDFKTVNDSLGHSAGDEVLGEIAHRLRSCTRVGDTVARMGGDEFGVLLVGHDASTRASRIADRIVRELSAPLEVRARPIALSASIGIASGDPTQTAQEILRDSDLALYAAKRAGKGQAHLYEPFMHAAALDRLELEADLRLALERGELELHYQPLFRLADGELAGYEALMRWNHPTRGLLLPQTFIELAEQTGLIVPLTRWALQTACGQAAAWRERAERPLEVAVNLSYVNLKDEAILDHVSAALTASDIAPHELVLEITEGNTMLDEHASRRILSELKGLGIRLALDDFGTGYSSLSRLSQLPFDSLKIPRPFVERITHNDATFALTQGIVDLGHRLELSIVAEGIETPTQLARVRAIGCELGQGYHLARPASGTSTNPDDDRSLRHRIAPDPPPAGRSVSLTLVGADGRPLQPSQAADPPAGELDAGASKTSAVP